MGGGMMEADLTHRALEAMSLCLAGGLRPPVVLQVARAPAISWEAKATERYGLLLSDGVHSQEALLPVSMSCLVRAGHLRAGSLVRLLDYYLCNSTENNNRRVIIVIQLEVLQTECTLIGTGEIYEVNATQQRIRSFSDLPRACKDLRVKQGLTDIACYSDQAFSISSCAAVVDNDTDKLRTYYLVAARNKIIAEMQQQQQISLQSNGGQSLAVPFTCGGFDCRDNTYRTISQIKDENSRMLRQPGLITVMATISLLNMDTFCYPACNVMFNGKKCNRKVTKDGDGWWCTGCLYRSKTCEYRYMLVCQIHDPTGSTYATAFDEAAEEIIGHTAQDLLKIQNAGHGIAKIEEIMRGILGRQHVLKLSIKEEAGHRVKRYIVKAEKLEYQDTHAGVLGLIDKMLNGNSLSAPMVQDIVTPSIYGTYLQAYQQHQAWGQHL